VTLQAEVGDLTADQSEASGDRISGDRVSGDRVSGDRLVLTPDYFDRALAAEEQRLARIFAGIQQPDTPPASSLTSDSGSTLPADLNPISNSLPPGSSSASGRSNALFKQLLKAGDQFIVYRASTQGASMIAGYPWFNDWGRDTLIALPGLTLTTQRWSIAQGLLRTFGQHCQQGLIPNAFPDAGAQPFYNSLDASLWWIETLGLYLEATQDWAFLAEQYPVVWGIYKGLMVGTHYGIRVDAFDGLVTWDAPHLALTWMDAVVAEEPVTPRRGKPVEINALWYSALCWAHRWAEQLQAEGNPDRLSLANQARRFATQIEQVKGSLQKYWHPAQGYLYDTILPDDSPDTTIRPNAVIALSLFHCGFAPSIGQSVLKQARDRLLTPYGLRSLDPADPNYVRRYQGGIWQRDRAYHQGTVWPWLIGSFLRAWQRFYPQEPLPFDWQPLLDHLQQEACLGSISEMFDGDTPHLPKGAIAQAWSVAEVIRHYNGAAEIQKDEYKIQRGDT
jgi:4-alpha-glucanotransferase